MVGFFQSNAVAQNGLSHLFDGCILRHNRLFQFVGHAFQPYAFGFCHSLNRYTRHNRDNICHLFLRYRLPFGCISISPLTVHFVKFLLQTGLQIPIIGGQFIVLVHYRTLFFLLGNVQFFFFLNHSGRHFDMLQVYFCSYFVQRINGFIGKSTVGDIAFCQFDTGPQCLICIAYVMMPLIPILYILNNL